MDDTTSRLPPGNYPAMLTAFHEDGSLDWEGVDRLTEFCIEAGVAGLFACGLSAEIQWMDAAEKVALADHIVKRTAGRVTIVAAAICGDSPEQQAVLVRRIHEVGADAVAVAACQLAGEAEGDDVWIQRVETLLERIPAAARLALYECPLPYQRLLSEETFRWVAATGRCCFLKDTCCSIETIRARLETSANTPLQLYNANTATLLESLRSGADGFCGIGANYFPDLYSWLCKHFDEKPELARDLHDFLDGTLGLTEGQHYPLSAKEYLRQQGLDISSTTRKPLDSLPADFVAGLKTMGSDASAWQERLGS